VTEDAVRARGRSLGATTFANERPRKKAIRGTLVFRSEVFVLEALFGMIVGFWAWFALRYGAGGFYTVGPNERAVVTTFGQAARLGDQTTLSDPISATLKPEERERYVYPLVRVIGPGFYWKLPWQKVHRVSIATGTV
jgi:hypothetical protein